MSKNNMNFAELAKASSNRMQEVVNSVSDRRTMMSSNPSHAGQTNSSTPCAACKLLRRRCAQECPFSPYFSPHEPQKFACVHKIFGASNVSKMLMEVPESQRADTASSLVYEANARIRDPVYGCMGAISALQQQAQSLQAELNAVRQEIMRYRRYDNAAAVGAVLHISHSGSLPPIKTPRTPPPPPPPLHEKNKNHDPPKPLAQKKRTQISSPTLQIPKIPPPSTM
ncbi:unnamed protein product, partial [Sphagnum balticum]